MILARDIGLGAMGVTVGDATTRVATARQSAIDSLFYYLKACDRNPRSVTFTANWKLVALVAGVWPGPLSVAGNIILFPLTVNRGPTRTGRLAYFSIQKNPVDGRPGGNKR
jgi:hypothetical protein